MDENLGIKEIWAKTKPFQSLLAHSINSGNVAKVLLTDSALFNVREYLEYSLGLNEDDTIDFCSYIISLHDIGKCHPFFQEQEKNMCEKLQQLNMTQQYSYHFRHEKESQRVIKQLLLDKGMDRELSKNIGVIIGKHHDKRVGKQGDSKELHPVLKNKWGFLQYEIICKLDKIFRLPEVKISKCNHKDGAFMVLWGLMILSDWIASGEYFYESNKVDCEDNINIFNKWSYEKARQAVLKIGLNRQDVIADNVSYNDILEGLNDETLRPVQRVVKDFFDTNNEQVDMLIIEAPMGEGKTEVAEFAASRMGCGKRGIYFALPTSATSNQMYKRVNKFLTKQGNQKSNLLHSTSWVVEDEDKDMNINGITNDDSTEVDNFLKGTRKGMLSTNCVGTVDQLMMSVLPVRFSILRLLGMVGKVVIIDEVHAYDAYMSSILEVVLSWCKALKIPIILLSATLPNKKKKALIEGYIGDSVKLNSTSYPLITVVKENNSVVEIEVQGTHIQKKVEIETYPYLGNLEKVALLTDRVKNNGGCMAFIMNTVKESQALYKEVKSYLRNNKDIDIILFHARFPAKRRGEIESYCINSFGKSLSKRPKKAVVIATQVLEQSLDVDFDWIVSAIAPIDLLLQRLGRQQRFNIKERLLEYKLEKFTILLPETENYLLTSFIYSDMILNRTSEALKEKTTINIPFDMRSLIENVYSEGSVDEEEYEKWFELVMENQIKAIQGKHTAINKPDPDEFGLANTNYMTLDENNEKDKYIVAKTRFGLPSRRVAFIEEQRFREIDFTKLVSKEIAKEVLQESLSLMEYSIVQTPFYGFLEPVEGQGFLRGMLIYPIKNNIYMVDDEKICGYVLDKELGLEVIYKKGGNH